MIWVYEKKDGLKFQTHVNNVGHETSYYGPEVETYLANQIEFPANAVIKKIRNRETITTIDKLKLATYMVVMLKRVPDSKIRLNKMAPTVLEKQQAEWNETIDKLLEKDPTQAEILEKRRNEINAILTKYAENIPKDLWLLLIAPENTPNILKVLQQMTWHFFTYDEAPIFLTCDNPIFYFRWLGIGKLESEVTFPISSNIVLWATWRKDLKGEYSQPGTQICKEINRRTVVNATRFVYHAKDEYWVHKVICKDNHRLNRLI
jgi:hypothetical protein